jgi:two-component system, LytTR family, sensor kinase
MAAIRSNGALWHSGEHRIPVPGPARTEPGRLAAIEVVALHRELGRWKARAAELERRAAAAEAHALGAQLTPHFLSNSLQAVSTLLHRDPSAADAMVVALSGLLRMTLRGGISPTIPLARELALLERYVAIMRFRFGDTLTVTTDVAPDAREAFVPQLVLQPIVENSIRHGFGERGGTVHLAAARHGDLLRFTIADDGRGLRPGPLVEGVGLGGTRARLRAMYGERQRVDLSANAAGGVTVTLALPYRVTAEGEEIAP